jgi:hypothetical protein
VADRSTQLVLSALSHAAAAGAIPLFGGKAAPGLFPTTALGKQAAQRCQDEGYLRLVPAEGTPPGPVPGAAAGGATAAVKKGRGPVALCAITDKGLAYLLAQVSPRQVLEDFVRVLEARQAQLGELLAVARQAQAGVEALKASAEQVLHHVEEAECRPEDPEALPGREPGPSGTLNALFRDFQSQAGGPGPPAANGAVEGPVGAPVDCAAVLLSCLAAWQGSGASEDCPLPELYRQARGPVPGLSVGQFHDALRRLHEAEQIYLHPWTGPLYEVPEPPYALLVGHEVAYYASAR